MNHHNQVTDKETVPSLTLHHLRDLSLDASMAASLWILARVYGGWEGSVSNPTHVADLCVSETQFI